MDKELIEDRFDSQLDEEEEQKVEEADPLLDPEDYLSNEEYEEIVGRKLE